MSVERDAAIEEIRRFNRHYVPRMRLLEQRYLGTGLSVIETDVLIEIGEHESCSARDVAQELCLDKGYLSRIIARLVGRGLVTRAASPADGRVKALGLTPAGRVDVEDLARQGARVVESALGEATDAECVEVARCMRRIMGVIDGDGNHAGADARWHFTDVPERPADGAGVGDARVGVAR